MGKRKVWKTALDAKAGMSVTDETVTMQSSKGNFIVQTDQGTFHGGKHSFICSPSDIRIAGNWVFNDHLVSTLPSTIVTPMPVLTTSYPIAGVANIASMVASFSSMLI